MISIEQIVVGRASGRFFIYLAVLTLLVCTWNGGFPLDDAYITLHNARVLLEGRDPVYGVPALIGATSSVHLALLAIMGTLLPLPVASLAINVAAGVAYALGLDKLVRQAGVEGWQTPVLVVTGLLAGTASIQLVNGLETGLAMATVTWLLVLADDRRLPLLVGIAPFVRPELAILAGLLMVRRLYRDRFSALPSVAIAAAVALPWIVWLWLATGSPLANTASAKEAFFAEAHSPWSYRIGAIYDAFAASGTWAILIGVPGLRRVKAGWCALGFILLVLAVVSVTVPGALNWNDARYLAVFIPALIYGLAALSASSGDRVGPVLVAMVATFTLIMAIKWVPLLLTERKTAVAEVREIARTMAQVPPGATVLIHDAGMVAWGRPNARLIDVVGLKTPSSVAFHRAYTRGGCQWDRALDAIARKNNATYALILQEPFWDCVSADLTRAGWVLTPLPSGQSRYQLYRIARP